jgi:hypothetical protein
VADLGRFLRVLEETEHFCGRGQEKVAKIVQCGEPRLGRPLEVNSAGIFSLPCRIRNANALDERTMWSAFLLCFL